MTSISKSQVAYYSKKYKRPVHFIPNGISISKLDQIGSANEIFKKHNITSNYLLFAARRIIPLKGCHTLIKALNQIDYKGTLIISGDKDQVPSYTRLLTKEAAKLDVRFIGYVSDQKTLNALIKGADFFVFPSEIEGMSMMLLEVAFNGTPLICSDIPQNKDVLDDDQVLYFESKNANDLSKKIQFAYDNYTEMQAMAKKAKNKIKNEYDVENIIEQYIRLYNRITHLH